MKPDYTEFDTALLDLIANGCNTLGALDNKKSGLQELAKPFRAKHDRWGTLTPTFRVIDRRLQALRKRGELQYTGKVWARVLKHDPV